MRLVLLLFLAQWAFGVDVLEREYDNHRTGANTAETALTRSAVAGHMHLVHTCTLDAPIFAAPLIKGGVAFYTTMANSIYAMTEGTCTQLWKVTLATAAPATPTGLYFYSSTIGCVATPVIGGTVIYALCLTDNGGGTDTGTWKLFARNISDGSQAIAPATIAATASAITFTNSTNQLGRSGLLYANGEVYIDFGSYLPGTEANVYFGWLLAYNATTLALDHTFCVDCAAGGNGGGLWTSGGGISADASGNICVVSGNGDWNGTSQYGESVIKFSSSTMAVTDFFTPTNWATLNMGDRDLGTSRCMFIDDTRMVVGGKDGRFWLLDATNMGHLQSGGIGPIQVWTPQTEVRNYFAFANNVLYAGASGNDEATGLGRPFESFAYSGGMFNTTPTATSQVLSSYGFGMSYSSNGTQDGILWVTSSLESAYNTAQSGTLYALNSDNLETLWSSGPFGNIAKLVPPVVANGNVHIVTHDGTVLIYNAAVSPSTVMTRTVAK